jgi:hypothetical protein
MAELVVGRQRLFRLKRDTWRSNTWPALGWLLGTLEPWGVLGCPLTYLCLQECKSIASEYDSSALHCEVASNGTR